MLTKIILILSLFGSLTLSAETHFLLSKTRNKEVIQTTTQSNIGVKFNIEQFDSNETSQVSALANKKFRTLKFRSLDLTSEVGEPTLPFYPIIVVGNPEDIEVKVIPNAVKAIDGLVPVPYQTERKRCDDCNDHRGFDYNPVVYTTFTPKYFNVEGMGEFRGVPISIVNLLPARYNGLKDRFEINPNIEYLITSKNRGISEFIIDQVMKSFLKENKRYLIVSPSRFHQALKPFVDWKTKLGFTVDLVSLESMGADFESIKKSLKKRYNDRKTKFLYALLVGNEEIFPTEYVFTTSDRKTPSDIGYFVMGGLFDFVPDVLSGRLVVSSEEEVTTQTSKIIQYEKKNYNDPSGLKKLIGIASNEGSDPSDEEYLKQMIAPFEKSFGFSSNLFLQKDYQKDADDLVDAINGGVSWINYIGHGSGTSWASTNGDFGVSHIEKLRNADVKPIIIDVACLNGRFHQGSFGERFMNSSFESSAVGGVAYYGGSVSISWRPPAVMAIGINQMIVDKNLDTLGAALMAGQLYLATNYTNKFNVYENFRWYHLFGDPSMKLNLK